jgi:formylglycine-generating enzyme required for sulfatase activity
VRKKQRLILLATLLACLTATAAWSAPAQARQTAWTDPVTGMEFLWVPQGCYKMGDTFGAAASDEKPVHEVCVDGFWLAKYPVTQAQWTQVMGANPSKFKDSGKNPVDSISWDDAKRFAAKLSAAGKGAERYRLPTEAEWEYACRSGGRHEMFAGGADAGKAAWYAANSEGSTHPVGAKEPNGLGLHDMSGNVFQWVEDMYEKDAYARHGRNNPVQTTGWGRVARGGWWGGEANSVRCTFRCYQSDRCKPASTGMRLVRMGANP